MWQSTAKLNLESLKIVPSLLTVAKRCDAFPALHGVQIHVLGVNGAGTSSIYWQSLHEFWEHYFYRVEASLKAYSILSELR